MLRRVLSLAVLPLCTAVLIACQGSSSTDTHLESTIAAQSTQISALSEQESGPANVAPTETAAVTPTTAIPDPTDTPRSTPTSEPSIPPTVSQETECAGNQWQIKMGNVFEVPLSQEGWKAIVVPLIHINDTPYWAEVDSVTDLSIRTRDDFTYPLLASSHTYLEIEEAPDPVYSGIRISSSQFIRTHPSGLLIPPGFAVRAYKTGGVDLGPTIDDTFQISFRVPTAQRGHSIVSERTILECIRPDGSEERERLGNVSIGLDGTSVPLPVDPSQEYPEALGYELEIPGLVKFTVTELESTDWDRSEATDEELDIRVSVENLRPDADIQGSFSGSYLIGSDGVARPAGCKSPSGYTCTGIDGFALGGFTVGPTLTKEAEMGFIIDPSITNYKLVLISEEFGVRQVLNLGQQ